MAKKPKNIMKEFIINEISGVDDPAQAGATAVLMKRSTTKTKEDVMTEEEKAEALKSKKVQDDKDADAAKALKKANDDKDAAVAELAKAKALAAMSDAEKAHLAALPEAEQAGFIAKSSDERKAVLADIAKGNPVVYKAADGTEFRKNDDARLVAMAKRADEAEKTSKLEVEKRQDAEIAKRAESELNFIKGDKAEKIALLKAVAGIADEGIRAKVQEMVKAANESMSAAFKTLGFGKADAGSPQGKLDTLAKSYADANKVTISAGMDAVLKTAEGKALYDETQKK